MIELTHLPIRHGKVPLRIARGHFATNHSHINYYIDLTFHNARLSEAKDSAYELVSSMDNNVPGIPSFAWTAPMFWVPALQKN